MLVQNAPGAGVAGDGSVLVGFSQEVRAGRAPRRFVGRHSYLPHRLFIEAALTLVNLVFATLDLLKYFNEEDLLLSRCVNLNRK